MEFSELLDNEVLFPGAGGLFDIPGPEIFDENTDYLVVTGLPAVADIVTPPVQAGTRHGGGCVQLNCYIVLD